jgi:HNH endonuclease
MDSTLRNLVWLRAGNRCEYCRIPDEYDYLPFAIDHIVAEKHRGETIEQNLALACCHCNGFKGSNIASIDEVSGELVRLYHPRTDKWGEHFVCTNGVIAGRTAVGRATIHVLNINDPERIELRELLIAQDVAF